MGTQTRFLAPEQDFIPSTLSKSQVRKLPYFIYRKLVVKERPPPFPTDETLWSCPMPSVSGMTACSPVAEPGTITPASEGSQHTVKGVLMPWGNQWSQYGLGAAGQAARGKATPVSHEVTGCPGLPGMEACRLFE